MYEDPVWNQSEVEAERNRLCGVPCDGWLVVAPAPLRGMRTYWLLRQLAQPAQLPTRCGGWSPRRHQLRAGRALVLELSNLADGRGKGTGAATRSSGFAARARASRQGAARLAIKAQLIGTSRSRKHYAGHS
jgi:hypothetical protein